MLSHNENLASFVLTRKGEMKEEEAKEEKHHHRRECRYGRFAGSIPLPAMVQSDKATAQLKEGILELRIPKSEKSKARQIQIQS